jgi:hypothetical protein
MWSAPPRVRRWKLRDQSRRSVGAGDWAGRARILRGASALGSLRGVGARGALGRRRGSMAVAEAAEYFRSVAGPLGREAGDGDPAVHGAELR